MKEKDYRIVPSVFYIVHLTNKNHEFMFVRFYAEDFEKGKCTVRQIENHYCKGFIQLGWRIIDIERRYTSRTAY